MSRVKKLLSLILALAMIFSLAACEKAQTNSGEDGPIEGNVVSGGEGAGPDQAQAVSEPPKSSPNGTYVLSEGEAVIDDVDFSFYEDVDESNLSTGNPFPECPSRSRRAPRRASRRPVYPASS